MTGVGCAPSPGVVEVWHHDNGQVTMSTERLFPSKTTILGDRMCSTRELATSAALV